jgi:hypothetical protein
MTTSDLRPDDAQPEGGVSRRTLLTRTASAGAGIILSGSIPGCSATRWRLRRASATAR